jgi:hypothetical protein
MECAKYDRSEGCIRITAFIRNNQAVTERSLKGHTDAGNNNVNSNNRTGSTLHSR